MFSVFVLLVLFILLLMILYYILGRLKVFYKIGNFISNISNMFKEENNKKENE